MQITLKMIEEKEFSIVPNGFNPEEVDNFLDEIWETMDQLLRENSELNQKLAAAARVPAPAPAPAEPAAPAKPAAAMDDAAAEDLKEILVMAQQIKRDTIAKAKADAAEILAMAEKEAEDQLGSLTDERNRLEEQVAGLKKVASEYRVKFEALLAAQQDAIDKASELF